MKKKIVNKKSIEISIDKELTKSYLIVITYIVLQENILAKKL